MDWRLEEDAVEEGRTSKKEGERKREKKGKGRFKKSLNSLRRGILRLESGPERKV